VVSSRANWQPRGYGWTNLALYVLCAVAVVLLTLALGLPMQSAMLADLAPVKLRR
jgi:hypothetical protein